MFIINSTIRSTNFSIYIVQTKIIQYIQREIKGNTMIILCITGE